MTDIADWDPQDQLSLIARTAQHQARKTTDREVNRLAFRLYTWAQDLGRPNGISCRRADAWEHLAQLGLAVDVATAQVQGDISPTVHQGARNLRAWTEQAEAAAWERRRQTAPVAAEAAPLSGLSPDIDWAVYGDCTTQAQIDRLIKDTIDRVEPEKRKRVTWRWGTQRMTSAAGYYSVNRRAGTHEIKLSPALWRLMPTAERIDTVIHETCHHTDYCESDRVGHGYRWRAHMRRAGVTNVRRTHSIDTSSLDGSVRIQCECGAKVRITKNRMSLARAGHLACKRCRAVVKLPS